MLLLCALVFRWVGERWWVLGVALYAPRVLFGVPIVLFVVVLLALRRPKLLWTQAIASLVLVFPVMGFTFQRLPRTDDGMPVMRVLSYNIDSGTLTQEYDGILQEVDRYAPDVAFLQEVGAADKLALLLESRYDHVFAANQFVVATKYPIVSTTMPDALVVNGRQHSPRYLRIELDTPLGRVVFYDVHPISPRVALWHVMSGGRRGLLTGKSLLSTVNATSFYDNSALRERQAAAFGSSAARETSPVVIAGDTNLPDLSWVFDHYLSRFQDAFITAGWGFGYTFPTDHHGPWMRIDRILANQRLRFVHFEVGTSKASDHFCVVADAQLRSR